jgi:hypothetical protein
MVLLQSLRRILKLFNHVIRIHLLPATILGNYISQNFILDFCKLLQPRCKAHSTILFFIVNQEKCEAMLIIVLSDVLILFASKLYNCFKSNLRPCFLEPLELFFNHFAIFFVLTCLDHFSEGLLSCFITRNHVAETTHHVVSELYDRVEMS